MCRFRRREPGALRYGAPLLPRDMKGGVEVACTEALSAELHSKFSNAGIERGFPAHEACAMLPRMLPQPCGRRSES
jgi:hypothetical protein